MEMNSRTRLGFGMFLVILGLWFLAVRLVPGLEAWVDASFGWPVIVIGVGVALLLVGLLIGAPSMAVPAFVVGGIGALLFWQNATDRWESWAYAWALIPGFIGLGTIVSGLLEGRASENLRSGGRLVLISLVMFFIFGSFLGGGDLLGPYWPVMLIVLGLVVLAGSILRPRGASQAN